MHHHMQLSAQTTESEKKVGTGCKQHSLSYTTRLANFTTLHYSEVRTPALFFIRPQGRNLVKGSHDISANHLITLGQHQNFPLASHTVSCRIPNQIFNILRSCTSIHCGDHSKPHNLCTVFVPGRYANIF